MKAALTPAQEVDLLARADAGEALHAIAASLGIPEHKVLSIVTKRAVVAAKATGVSYAIAQRARRALCAEGKVPGLEGLPRRRPAGAGPLGIKPRDGSRCAVSFWIDADVVEEMESEAQRTGLTISQVAQDAWKRARRTLRRRRAP